MDYLTEKLTFNCTQFGFVQGVSTSHSTLLLKEIVYNYKKNNKKIYCIFADLFKAFDRVDHFKLGNILLNRCIPSDIVSLIMFYLRNQLARVKWGKSVGKLYLVDTGVRQGGILSPILFKLYIDEILKDLNDMNEGCKFGLSRISIIAYADDMVILSNSIVGLRILYEVFKNKLENMNLKININKTKCIIFGRNSNVSDTIDLGIAHLKL